MRRDFAGLLVGIAGGILFFALPYLEPKMSHELATFLVVLSVIAIIVGVAMFFWPSKKSREDQKNIIYNIYNLETHESESHRIPAESELPKPPDRNALLYQIGLDIQEFEKLFKLIGNDTDEKIVEKFNDARSALNLLLDKWLPKAKLILNFAEEVEKLLIGANGILNQFAMNFEIYRGVRNQAKEQMKFSYPAEETQNQLIYYQDLFWGGKPNSLNTQMQSLIKQLIEVLRKEGREQ